VHNSVKSNELELKCVSSETAVWSEIKLNGHDNLIVGVVYRSPSSTDDENEQFINMITSIVNMRSSHLMIMGDFNYAGID